MANKHGVFIREEATAVTVPQESSAGVQVVIGTAPVNLAEDPYKAANTPILATKASEAMAALGYSEDFKNYTLCQSMYVTQSLYPVAPVVYINVLDPSNAKHTEDIAKKDEVISLNDSNTVVIEETGILKKTVKVKKGVESFDEIEATKYVLGFTSEGYLSITLTAEGKEAAGESIKVEAKKLKPSGVTEEDVIGKYDAATGKESGMEVIRQIYPKLGVVPGILLAPGFSQKAKVGIALSAKAVNINGVFKAVAYLDIPCNGDGAKKYTDIKEKKEKLGFTSEYAYCLWPKVQVGDYALAFSAVAAARTAAYDAENDDMPSASPSNKSLAITGTILEDGTEVILDQDQGTTVNEYGVATAINLNGFRLWGNYTAAYPASGDAKDIYINIRRMFNWQGNTFIQTYFDRVDDPMNAKLIENIVDSENIRCAAYAPAHWAGAWIVYLAADNSQTDILAGHVTFRQHIAPYTPAETIENILSYDIDMLQAALGGE